MVADVLIAVLILISLFFAFAIYDQRRQQTSTNPGGLANPVRPPAGLDPELWQEARKREQRELAEDLASLESEAAELSFELTRRQKLVAHFEQLQAQIERDKSITAEERTIRAQILKHKLTELLGDEQRPVDQTIDLQKEGATWQDTTARPANTDGKSASGDA